jgi:hypothetical protein
MSVRFNYILQDHGVAYRLAKKPNSLQVVYQLPTHEMTVMGCDRCAGKRHSPLNPACAANTGEAVPRPVGTLYHIRTGNAQTGRWSLVRHEDTRDQGVLVPLV